MEWKAVDGDPDDLYDQFVSHEELKALSRATESAREIIHLARTRGAEEDGEASVQFDTD